MQAHVGCFGPLGAAHEKVVIVGVYPVTQDTEHVAAKVTVAVYNEYAPHVPAVVAVFTGTAAK